MQIDVALVARATGAVAARTAAGVALGIALGAIGFVVEKATGLLDASGWWGRASWLLLPAYVIAGAAALGLIGLVKGKRRAAVLLLIDSGLVADLTRRAIAQSEVQEPPGHGVVAWAKRLARGVIANEVKVLDPRVDPTVQAGAKVREAIGEWGQTGVIVALLLLAAGMAAAPVACAVT